MFVRTVNKASDEKNIVVITGSPRKAGNTAKLLDAFLSELPKTWQIAVFDSYAINPSGCTDCGWCRKKDGCSQRDLDELYSAYENADIIVIATPVYNYSFPAPLKAVIDRFQVYYNARFARNIRPPIKKHKEAVLLMTCGGDGTEGAAVITKQLNRIFTVLNTTLKFQYTADNLDKKHLSKADLRAVKTLAQKMMK